MDSGFQELDSGFVVIGTCIPDFSAQDSRFCKYKCVRIPDSTSKTFTDFGFRISLHGAERERFSKSERFSKPVLYSEPLDISRTATPTGEFEIIKIRIGTSSGKNNY